jgi:hypothetical protein
MGFGMGSPILIFDPPNILSAKVTMIPFQPNMAIEKPPLIFAQMGHKVKKFWLFS